MTFNQLQCFVAVAKELNFAKAAKSLFLSTSAVSRQITALEDDLGAELFLRDQKTVRLTSAGIQFYAEAADILERVSLSRQCIQKRPGTETLFIGLASSMQLPSLSGIYREYHQAMPHVMVNNSIIMQYGFHRSPLADRIDVFFMPNERTHSDSFLSSTQEYIPLRKSHLSCVVPKGHKLENRESVDVRDLVGETLILLDYEHCSPSIDELQMEMRRLGQDTTYYYSGSSYFTAPMIEGGLGIAVMPDFVCPPSDLLVRIPYRSKQQWEYGIVIKKNEGTDKVQKFVEVAKRVCSRI